MSDTIHIKGLRFEHKKKEYVCDFNAFYELSNPRDDIYTPDGAAAPERGQDEVNFIMVQLTEVVRLTPKFSSVIDQEVRAELEEICLDWCRDDVGATFEAFKMSQKMR